MSLSMADASDRGVSHSSGRAIATCTCWRIPLARVFDWRWPPIRLEVGPRHPDTANEVPRSGQGLHPLRRRRQRRGLVPPREVHRVRRARRRRRRPGRRRLGGRRRRAQHADRLPLPAAFQGQDRRQRHGPQPHRRRRRRRRAEGAGRHADLRGGQRDADRRPRHARPARAARQGRQWRLRQRAFQDVDQPRAAPRQSRPAGQERTHLAAAQADRRCRPGRPAQCRQVDLPRRGHGGAGRRSPTIPSPRSIPGSAWCASTAANSSSPTFPA